MENLLIPKRNFNGMKKETGTRFVFNGNEWKSPEVFI
jgi:hypothetical protein